jgi:hypothetical protein
MTIYLLFFLLLIISFVLYKLTKNKFEKFENQDIILVTELKNNSIGTETIDLTTERETLNIPKEEISVITSAFIQYYNIKNSSNFFILEMPFEGIKAILVPGTTISKKYIIPLFIYEKDLNYLIRLRITVYMTSIGKITLTLLEEFKEIQSDLKLLPGLEKELKPIVGDFKIGETKFIQLFTEEDQRLEDLRLAKIKELDLKYECLGIPGKDINNKQECDTFGGVWDRPVKDDQDCPFYKANKNYDNIRGRAKNGYCEMPSGITIKGYRFYDKNPEKFLPQCYQCKDKLIGQGNVGLCCADQNDPLKYPNLKSPDYKFPGDLLDRPKN